MNNILWSSLFRDRFLHSPGSGQAPCNVKDEDDLDPWLFLPLVLKCLHNCNMDHRTWFMLCWEWSLKLCAFQVHPQLQLYFYFMCALNRKDRAIMQASIISIRHLSCANLQMGFLKFILKYPKLPCSFSSAILTQVYSVFKTVGYLPRSSISWFWNMVSYAAQSDGKLHSDI